jgi:hypothetical protein
VGLSRRLPPATGKSVAQAIKTGATVAMAETSFEISEKSKSSVLFDFSQSEINYQDGKSKHLDPVALFRGDLEHKSTRDFCVKPGRSILP